MRDVPAAREGKRKTSPVEGGNIEREGAMRRRGDGRRAAVYRPINATSFTMHGKREPRQSMLPPAREEERKGEQVEKGGGERFISAAGRGPAVTPWIDQAAPVLNTASLF